MPHHDRSRSSRALDACVGLVLASAAFAVLMATTDMGFVRDEAFYFRHAETYQNWFMDVEAGGPQRQAALTRDSILKTWRNNFEHPPLNKVLFGYSWRFFGRKLRPVQAIQWARAEAGTRRQVKARIVSLGRAQGFDEGARVVLLRPQEVGASPATEGRELAAGAVTKRDSWSAEVLFDEGVKLADLERVCAPPGPPTNGEPGRRTGCEAMEERGAAIWSESDAMRAPGAFFAALLVLLVWLTARGEFSEHRPWMSRPLAALAASGFLLLPRPFFHSHLACFDISIVTLLFATTVAYHRSLRSTRWVWLVGVLWGLALLTKHNALFFPVVLMAHWAWDGLAEGRLTLSLSRRWSAQPRARLLRLFWMILVGLMALTWWIPTLGVAAALCVAVATVELRHPPVPLAWFVMLPVGLVVLLVGWPLLWVDTIDNLLRWIEFHLHHEHYMQEYFGQVLAYPPFPISLPWVLTALTWPLTLLIPAVLGWGWALAHEARFVYLRLRSTHEGDEAGRPRRSGSRLWLLSVIWPIALISLPSTPVFGGTKHWFLAYPFMLLLAGRLLEESLSVVATARRTMVSVTLVLVLTLPAAMAVKDAHPHGTAYYNSLIGGVSGAARAGLQRQFWGGATREGLATVNKGASRGARVWFHNCAWGAYDMYQREGWFRRDLRYHGQPAGAEFGFYHHQRDHDDYEVDCIKEFGAVAPVEQHHLEAVPLLSVYKRPTKELAPGVR